MADNCVCAQPGEYHLRSDHRHNGDDCLVAYDERCPCKKFKLGERVDVAAENARLQAELKSVKRVLEMDDPRLLQTLKTIERLIAERDGYAAQSKVREKALEALARRLHHKEEHPWIFEDCMRADCYEARAAIAAEEARETERR